MDHDAVLLTQSGVEKLKQEKEQLINVERPKVIEELQLARSQGDLSEMRIMMQLEINRHILKQESKKLIKCFYMCKLLMNHN